MAKSFSQLIATPRLYSTVDAYLWTVLYMTGACLIFSNLEVTCVSSPHAQAAQNSYILLCYFFIYWLLKIHSNFFYKIYYIVRHLFLLVACDRAIASTLFYMKLTFYISLEKILNRSPILILLFVASFIGKNITTLFPWSLHDHHRCCCVVTLWLLCYGTKFSMEKES
jgi:hypothetical protein